MKTRKKTSKKDGRKHQIDAGAGELLKIANDLGATKGEGERSVPDHEVRLNTAKKISKLQGLTEDETEAGDEDTLIVEIIKFGE